MKKENISSKSIFVFDAFGTLFKTSEIDAELQNIAKDKTENLLSIWRKKTTRIYLVAKSNEQICSLFASDKRSIRL